MNTRDSVTSIVRDWQNRDIEADEGMRRLCRLSVAGLEIVNAGGAAPPVLATAPHEQAQTIVAHAAPEVAA